MVRVRMATRPTVNARYSAVLYCTVCSLDNLPSLTGGVTRSRPSSPCSRWLVVLLRNVEVKSPTISATYSDGRKGEIGRNLATDTKWISKIENDTKFAHR